MNYSAWSLKPLQVVLAGGAVDGPTDKSKQDHLPPSNSSQITETVKLVNNEGKNNLSNDAGVRTTKKDISHPADAKFQHVFVFCSHA